MCVLRDFILFMIRSSNRQNDNLTRSIQDFEWLSPGQLWWLRVIMFT